MAVETKDALPEGMLRWNRFQGESDAPVPAGFYKNAERHTFTVWAETLPGKWLDVYHGNNAEAMSKSASFWDELVNVYIVDTTKVSRNDLMWLGLFDRIENDPNYGQK